MSKLALKYRPNRFEDVVGQRGAKALASFAKMGGEKNVILIVGPWGVGKTTLARLFAKALNCEAREPSGSPCNGCDPCVAFNPLDFEDYTEIDGGSYGGIEKSRELIKLASIRPYRSQRRVIAVDEAQGLTSKGADGLLKTIEHPPSHTTFVLMTTDPAMIKGSLRSRCTEVTLTLVPADEIVAFLESICLAEDIEYEVSALRLIAARADGHVRDAVVALDQIADLGPVTLAEVRATFYRHLEFLEPFLAAFAAADPVRIDAVLNRWNSPPRVIYQTIFEALVHIHTQLVLRLAPGASGSPYDALDPGVMLAIRDRFQTRADDLGVSVDEFWLGALGIWDRFDMPPLRSVLSTEVYTLNRVINGPENAAAFYSKGIGPGPAPRPPPVVVPKTRIKMDRQMAAAVPVEAYLSAQQVRAIFNTASYLPQLYGVLFNTRIVLNYAALGLRAEADIASLTSALTHELAMRIKDWASEPLHWVYVHEHCKASGPRTLLIAHIPDRLIERSQAWLKESFLTNRGLAKHRKGLVVECRASKSLDRAVDSHWSFVRDLTGGIHPGLCWAMPNSAPVALADLLKIPVELRRQVGVVSAKRRYSQSATLAEKVIREANAKGFALLSAFDDRQWSWISQGWEISEHQDRIEAREDLQLRLKLLETNGNHLERVAAREDAKMLKAEMTEAYRPGRTWVGWWHLPVAFDRAKRGSKASSKAV